MIKLETESEGSLPQGGTASTEDAVQPPMTKRKYNCLELPPTREGCEGARHEAFSKP